MHARHRGKNGGGVELVVFGTSLQFVRQYVEQYFRIGTGIDVAQVFAK